MNTYEMMDAAEQSGPRDDYGPMPLKSGPPMILQYWNAVVRWRWLMLGIIAGVMALGLVVTLFMSPQYRATVQIQIDRQQKQVTKVEGVEAETTAQDLEFYATQYALLLARPLAERVVANLRLADNVDFLAAHGVSPDVFTEDASTLSAAELRQRNRQIVVELLLKNVNVVPIRNSKLVTVSYTSRDAKLSTRIANAWAAAFIAESMNRQFASTADARKFLEERLVVLRQRLDESEKLAVTYASKQGIISLGESRDDDGRTVTTKTLAASQLEELVTALNDATASRISAEARSRSSAGATSESVTSPTLGSLRAQRASIASEYSKKRVQLEDGHPYVQELKQQLDSIDQALATETRRISQARSSEYTEAARREQGLRAQVDELKNRLDSQNKANIQYSAYLRDADTNRQIYDALLQRYKEIGVAGQVGVNNISIVEPAIEPDKPSSPKLILNLAIALVLGLALAGVTAVALEQIDEGVRDPNQVEAIFGSPLLGVTPNVDNEILDELADVKSHLYDAYFSVRTNLAFSTNRGFPKSLAVTSTRPSEGKSSTSAALAVILSRTGGQVLLIDGDLRSPSVHKVFGLNNDRGLSNFLAGNPRWVESIQQTSFDNLSILAAGPTPPSAAELLSGTSLAELVAAASARYDHVVIDAPPVLGMTDAPLIGKSVESVVYVVESMGPPVRGIKASIQRLAMANVRISGIVLTKMKQSTMGYGYGYGYGYGGPQYGEHNTD